MKQGIDWIVTVGLWVAAGFLVLGAFVIIAYYLGSTANEEEAEDVRIHRGVRRIWAAAIPVAAWGSCFYVFPSASSAAETVGAIALCGLSMAWLYVRLGRCA